MEALKGEQVKNLFRNTLSHSKKQRFKTLTYSPVKVRHGPALQLKQLFVANPAAYFLFSQYPPGNSVCQNIQLRASLSLTKACSWYLIVDAAPAN